ncbi:MAG: hypothetical protein P1V97_14460 [Planctomycetota bacterium]|nr:hypothetical protein [Planctomycetota bacterium]
MTGIEIEQSVDGSVFSRDMKNSSLRRVASVVTLSGLVAAR